MSPNTKTALIAAAASTTQSLPEPASAVIVAYILNGAATAGSPITGTELTVTTGTPTASQIQFTGTPHAPSSTVTLSAAPTAGELLLVTYVPLGALGAAA